MKGYQLAFANSKVSQHLNQAYLLNNRNLQKLILKEVVYYLHHYNHVYGQNWKKKFNQQFSLHILHKVLLIIKSLIQPSTNNYHSYFSHF